MFEAVMIRKNWKIELKFKFKLNESPNTNKPNLSNVDWKSIETDKESWD